MAQIETLASRVEPLLDDGLPKLQWFKDRIEELDCNVKEIRLAGERTLAASEERMADLERNLCGVSVGPCNEPSATNESIKPQPCTVVTSGSSCSLGNSEEKASDECLSETQPVLSSGAMIAAGKAAIPAIAEEVLCNEDGAAQTHSSTSLSPTNSVDERSLRGSRVRRLVLQFKGGAGAAASCSSAAGVTLVNTKPLAEPLDVSSCAVARHSQHRQQLQLPRLQPWQQPLS